MAKQSYDEGAFLRLAQLKQGKIQFPLRDKRHASAVGILA